MKAINLRGLVSIFNELVEDPMLFLDVPCDGCFYRANYICKKLVENGYEPITVMIGERRRRNDNLLIDINNNAWHAATYHVAAGVVVDGRVVIFDPLFFNAPEYASRWRDVMQFCDKDPESNVRHSFRPINEFEIKSKKYIQHEFEHEFYLDCMDIHYFFMTRLIGTKYNPARPRMSKIIRQMMRQSQKYTRELSQQMLMFHGR